MEEVQKSPVSGFTQKEPGSNGPKTKFGKWLDRYFHISERGSSILRELIGGLVIFLAMFYILPLNSNMLSTNWTSLISSNTSNVKIVDSIKYILIYGDVWATVDQVRAGIFAATAISACITTILMGFYGKLPVGLASGLGINSLIAYTVMLGMGFNFAQCMCLVLIDGVLFLIISLTDRKSVV